jgi:hypothetical protein
LLYDFKQLALARKANRWPQVCDLRILHDHRPVKAAGAIKSEDVDDAKPSGSHPAAPKPHTASASVSAGVNFSLLHCHRDAGRKNERESAILLKTSPDNNCREVTLV